jgi:hypothetical protein
MNADKIKSEILQADPKGRIATVTLKAYSTQFHVEQETLGCVASEWPQGLKPFNSSWLTQA